MATVGYIRVTGQHHAMHQQGAVLAVTDNRQANNPELIFRDDAHQLVDRGDAEWIRGSELPEETHEERAERHVGEVDDLADRHAAEHRALLSSHGRARESAEGRIIRHQAERRGLLAAQGREHAELMARHAGEPPDAAGNAQEHEQLNARHLADYRTMIGRQMAEPETQALAQFAEHQAMIARQVDEHARMLARHGAEQQPAAQQESANDRTQPVS